MADSSLALPNIPSIPLAWRDVQPLLQAIKGLGMLCPPEWKGGVPNVVEWWSGNLSSPIVHLKNDQDESEQQRIWNVMGAIRGIEQPEKSIIVGNRRDAWSFGASDPGKSNLLHFKFLNY
jgi:N-acetylated-alpha-linked acidic dipeptidase